MKRLAREAAAAANPMLSPEVHIMAQQVQEVLPHISLDQIKRDLGGSVCRWFFRGSFFIF